MLAWAESSWEATALPPAAVELACTTLEISLMPSSTEATISDCRRLAVAISSISTLIDWMQSLIMLTAEIAWSVETVPVRASWMERPMSTLVFWAASEDLAARLRTSSATTEKPFPAVPALAASTAAFSARMLVWKAMSSMVLMMPPIWLEDSSMFLVAAVSWAIFVSAWAA